MKVTMRGPNEVLVKESPALANSKKTKLNSNKVKF